MSKKTRMETANLAKMKVNELQARFAEVTGEKTRSPNKMFLIRKITEALQAKSVVESSSPGAKAATTVATKAAGPGPEKLTKLDVAELQGRYLELVGRHTGSTNRAYPIWKIREAQKGRIPLGPRKNAHREGGHVQGPAPAAGIGGRRQAGRGVAFARHQEPNGVLPWSTRTLPEAPRCRGCGCALCNCGRRVTGNGVDAHAVTGK
jgi:hypothetical protein